MKPSTPNQPASDSFFRYFKARFQPFRRPLFWGALGALSLLTVAIWQYFQHPEWLGGGEIEQPETTLEPTLDPTPTPAEPVLVPGSDDTVETPSAIPGNPASPQEPENLLDRLIPKQNVSGSTPSSGFPALVPNQSPAQNQSSEEPPATREELLNPASIDNSAFNNAANGQGSPSNLNGESSARTNDSANANPEQTSTNTSPLERAVDRVMAPNSGAPSAGGSTGSELEIDTSGYVPEAYGTTPIPNGGAGAFGEQSDYDRSVPRGYGELSPSGAGVDNYGGASIPTETLPPGQLNNYEFNNSFSPIPQSSAPNNAPVEQPAQPNIPVNAPDPQPSPIQEPIQTDQSVFDESPLFPE